MQRGQLMLGLGLALVLITLTLVYRYYNIENYGYGYWMSGFGYSLVAASFALLVLAALSPQSVLYKLRLPGAAPLAIWSYAIYLSHKPIAYIVQQQMAGLGVAGSDPLLIPVVLAACLLGGWLLFRLVETPFMALRDRALPGNFTVSR